MQRIDTMHHGRPHAIRAAHRRARAQLTALQHLINHRQPASV